MRRKPEAYGGSEPYIFISYAHADDAVVMPLIAGLQDRGFRVWYDEGITDSALWQKVIAEHLAKSYCVIAFISRSALISPNCRKEINFAVNLSERPGSNHASPLPVYLDDSALDYEMQMMLLPLQSRYYSRYPDAAALLDSLKDSASLQVCRASSDSELRYDRAKALQREGRYAEAASLLREAAELGLAAAQCSFGSCCAKGQGVPKDDTEAVKWYRMAARQNHAGALNNLAYCYYSGNGVQRDYEKAADLYRQAAQQGLVQGQFGLARCYELGHGVEQDLKLAWEWYCRARDGGHARAAEAAARCEAAIRRHAESPEGMFEQAEKLYGEENYEEAVALYTAAAKRGYAAAQHKLAACYYLGSGVAKDDNAAIEWERKAADQGYVEAQETLGGWLVLKFRRPEEGRKYWELAYKNGRGSAAAALALAYRTGFLGAEDLHTAIFWYRKAKELGCPDADEAIRECEAELKKRELTDMLVRADKLFAENRFKEALELYRQAALNGSPEAEYKVARCYHYGNGIRSDFEEAVKWYRRSAEHGYAEAQCYLGHFYGLGMIGPRQDHATGFKWFAKAANQGHAAAMEQVGDYYYNGYGVSRDYSKAYTAYAKAYKLEKGRGSVGLARCYENGHGVEKDIEKALAWYRSAKAHGNSGVQEDIRRCEAALKKKKNWWDN